MFSSSSLDTISLFLIYLSQTVASCEYRLLACPLLGQGTSDPRTCDLAGWCFCFVLKLHIGCDRWSVGRYPSDSDHRKFNGMVVGLFSFVLCMACYIVLININIMQT